MCDSNDDYEGFDNERSYDEEPGEADFEDDANDDLDDDLDDSAIENDVKCDDFLGKDAFLIVSAMCWGYDEGLWKGGSCSGKRRRPRKNYN
jgi:hypothetical protein